MLNCQYKVVIKPRKRNFTQNTQQIISVPLIINNPAMKTGLGLRYMTSREKKINLRLDYAQGVEGYDGVYFGEMAAF